jgi:hypothetical protein
MVCSLKQICFTTVVLQEHGFRRFFSESVGRKNTSPVKIIIRTNPTIIILGNRHIDYPKTASFNEKLRTGARATKKGLFS